MKKAQVQIDQAFLKNPDEPGSISYHLQRMNITKQLAFAFGVKTPANFNDWTACRQLMKLTQLFPLIHSLISSYSGAIRLDMQEETAERLHATLVEAGFNETNQSAFYDDRGKRKQDDPALLYFLASQAFSVKNKS
ncbi:hypothetical protein R0I01_18020 [Bacillus pumilus]|nr:hypothetical protein R0I01_18020 [Bacillus pumilus]